MGKEIERKFLVKEDSYRHMAKESLRIRQGYLSDNPCSTVRIRTIADKAFITIKGINRGIERDEWEYAVPHDEAIEMLERLCVSTLIDKTRYIVEYAGLKWEIDEFHHPVNNLVLAEVELESLDTKVSMPAFVGAEVSGNPQYYNSNIAKLKEHTN